MRNPGTDFYRRKLDAEATELAIRSQRQQARNAKAWRKMAVASALAGNLCVAANQRRQADWCDELLTTAEAFPSRTVLTLSKGPADA
jgi:hypothetical protein